MGIDAKHFYRFGYLKSEQWQTVRIEALAREKGKCQICDEFSVGNDAHHIEYPKNVWETTSGHLIILCRECHDLVHTLLEIHLVKAHTSIQFNQICDALRGWKNKKSDWIGAPPENRIIDDKKDPNRCRGCLQMSDRIKKVNFFEKFESFKKINILACPNCRSSIKKLFSEVDFLPEKPFKILDAWKKQRKIDGVSEVLS